MLEILRRASTPPRSGRVRRGAECKRLDARNEAATSKATDGASLMLRVIRREPDSSWRGRTANNRNNAAPGFFGGRREGDLAEDPPASVPVSRDGVGRVV